MTDSQTLKPPHADDPRYSLEAIADQLLPSVNQIFQIVADLRYELAEPLNDAQKYDLQTIERKMQLMLLMLTDPKAYHDELWKKHAANLHFDYSACDVRMRVDCILHDTNSWLQITVVLCNEWLNDPEYYGELSKTQREHITHIRTLARNIIHKIYEMSDQVTKLYKGNQP